MANWWNLAQSAAGGGFTATDTISAASAIAGQFGEPFAFSDSAAVAVLYGYANRMNTAAGIFQGAGLEDAIDASMIGTPPWARDQPEMNTAPIWHATFMMDYIDQGGEQRSGFFTSVFDMTLPGTVGGLLDDMTDDAQAMADKYGYQFVGIRPIQLLAV